MEAIARSFPSENVFRHSYKEVVGFDYLDFVDCNEAVNCQRSDCFQGSVREGPSEFDV